MNDAVKPAVSDEMVELFGINFWPINAASKIDAQREHIRNALSAALAAQGQEPVASIVPEHCSGSAFVFVNGCLHVRKDGSGYLVVDEDDFVLEDDRCEGESGPEGSVHWITRFPAGEMTTLRDFLNGQQFAALTAPAQPVGVTAAQDAVTRLMDAVEGECDGLAITEEQATAILSYVSAAPQPPAEYGWTFRKGDRVRKTKGASWQGRIVGFYSTNLTPVGYVVESEREPGSVQIYPEGALEPAPANGGEQDV